MRVPAQWARNCNCAGTLILLSSFVLALEGLGKLSSINNPINSNLNLSNLLD